MIEPSPFCRLNPSRAIFVTGEITRDLISRLTPDILQLQRASREPITVYIDSPGGSTAYIEPILRLLRLSDQDSSQSCHIITAVVNRAASLAADLLSSGDYAVAYPESTILYHGVRMHEAAVTVESASALGWYLRMSNDRYAMALARKIEERFSFRFMSNRSHFDAIRTADGKPAMTDLECFIKLVEGRLSNEAKNVWKKARDRHARYRDIFKSIINKSRADFDTKTRAELQGISIKAIVDFEIRANKKNPAWSFQDGGLQNLADDFFLLNEHLTAAGHERLKKWSSQFGTFMLPKAEADELNAIEDEQVRAEKLFEKVEPILEPLWSFFVALCHALQDGENELTGHDAYWLGLVDEVVGENLLSVRNVMEFRPDPPPATPTATA